MIGLRIAKTDINLKNEFKKMQRVYVFNENDIPSFKDMTDKIFELDELLLSLDESL